jgi:hypothetical protein
MILTNKKELERIEHEQNFGLQFRANCLEIKNNEYNTKYFYSKEKSRAEAKAMTTLINDKGEILTDMNEIANEQKSFYENLYREKSVYSEKDVNKANKYFLDDLDITEISDEERETLDMPISPDEIAHALRDLPNNKAPGGDGLSTNFYKFFWPKINKFVNQSIMCTIVENEMSIEQKRAILTLLPKKGKDSRYNKNWRPLSLLNTDYKIFAKLLAKRIQKILPTIINPDQSGCIKDRATFTNIRSTIDIINYANENNMPAIIAFIDFEKAFDTVNLSFLYKCLHKLNIGDFYRRT